MKRKSLRKIIAVTLAILMLLSLNLTGVLADEDPPNTVDASGRDTSKPVSLTIVKYLEVDELFDEFESDGLPQTIPEEEGIERVSGVTFKVVQVQFTGTGTPSNNPNHYTAIAGAEAAYGTTDGDGEVVFSSTHDETADTYLPGQGIYKVSEVRSATAGTIAIEDFIVSLPMANPDTEEGADPWLYDVYAYPKNDVRKTITKEIVENENPSNVITWRYGVIIPEDISNPPTGDEVLKITDELDYRLVYMEETLKGTYTNRKSTDEVDFDFTKDDAANSDYTLKVATDESSGVQTLTIELTAKGFAKLAEIIAVEAEEDDEVPMMYFSFDTKIDVGIDASILDEIYNGGELDYTNSLDEKYDTEEIDEELMPGIEIYGIKVHKINVNNEDLAGAKFTIYTSEDGEPAKVQGDALKNMNDETWELTTDDEGYVYFYGLVEGIYFLVETEPPAGYDEFSEPIQVEIRGGEGGTVDDENTVEITVTNKKRFTLPTTGGVGTIVFTAAGLALISAAVILLILAKRKKAKKNIDG